MTGPRVLKSGLATFQRRRREFMYPGGRLELTEDALHFVPHRFNFGFGSGDPVAIPLTEIESVSPIRPLALGAIPSLWSNGILVKGREGRFAYVIWVFRRSKWIEAIEAARGRHESVDWRSLEVK